MNYPDSPGFKRTDTSFSAAREMKPKAGTLRALVLDLVKRRDLTADEAAAMLGESQLSIRPRFTELRNMGLIRDTGKRRINDSTRAAIVWEAV